MKRVHNTEQVIHLWVHQAQSDARNANGSLYFNGADLYSYGAHYLMARVHERKGKCFALINSKGYSVTTAKHTSWTWRALRGVMPAFYSPDPMDVKAARMAADSAVTAAIESGMKRLKVEDGASAVYSLDRVADALKDANEFRSLLGLKPLKTPTKEIEALRVHLKKRLARWKELNTPEMLAKRSAESIKRAEAKERKLRADQERKRIEAVERIEKWRNGENVHLGYSALNFNILRIKGDTIQTNGGAEVPLDVARRLLMALKNGANIIGKHVGAFEINSIYPLDKDKVVRIGCHSILLSEIENVLGKVG